MYHKDRIIPFKSSASALCNNLSFLEDGKRGQTNYATVHRSVVNVVTLGSGDTGGPTPQALCASGDNQSLARQVVCKEPSGTPSFLMLLQIRWCELLSRTIMVVTSHRGIQMFEPDGSLMLYWHSLSPTLPSGESLSACFARGISAVGDVYVAVGTHTGNILIFSIPLSGTNVFLQDTLKQHKAAISDLYGLNKAQSDGASMASGDDDGNILVWKVSGQTFTVTAKIQGFRSPVTSVCIIHQCIVAGYGSGHIRVYGAQHGNLHCEVTAHTRWITAIDVAIKAGLVLSVSEDSFARVWRLNEGDIPELELKHSEVVVDTQLCGGKFLNPHGTSFCVSGYDVKEATVYSQ